MRAKLISEQGEKTFAVIFDAGDEVMAGLLAVSKEHNLGASHLTAIGAFSDVVLGYFERELKRYKEIPVDEQVEVLALIGDIALDDGEPRVHAHVVVGKSDGAAWGGQLMRAHVWPTLEVIIVESPLHLQRRTDPETGLARISL